MLCEQRQSFGEAVDRLACGGVVVYPTETYYGLGSLPHDAPVDRLVTIKGREIGKPLPLVVGSREMVAMVAREMPPLAELLADRFWPGPLTIVLPAKPDLPLPIEAGTGTVGVRVSAHPLAAELSKALGQPLVATSANPAGMPPPTKIATAISYFGSSVGAYLDGGELPGIGSTVVTVNHQSVQVVRLGAVSLSSLKQALPGMEF